MARKQYGLFNLRSPWYVQVLSMRPGVYGLHADVPCSCLSSCTMQKATDEGSIRQVKTVAAA